MTSRLSLTSLVLLLFLGALAVAVPNVLGARANEIRLDVSADCTGDSTSLRRDLTINIKSNSRAVAGVSFSLQVLKGSTSVIEERYPDVAGNFKETAEGPTSDGLHHLLIAAETARGELFSLESALDVSPDTCVASKKLFVGGLSWDTSD